MPAVEPTSTSEPCCLSTTERRKPRAVRNVVVRFARSVASQRSSVSSHTGTSSLADDGDADVELPGLLEEPVCVLLDREVAADELATDLRRGRLGAVAARAVVNEHM